MEKQLCDLVVPENQTNTTSTSTNVSTQERRRLTILLSDLLRQTAVVYATSTEDERCRAFLFVLSAVMKPLARVIDNSNPTVHTIQTPATITASLSQLSVSAVSTLVSVLQSLLSIPVSGKDVSAATSAITSSSLFLQHSATIERLVCMVTETHPVISCYHYILSLLTIETYNHQIMPTILTKPISPYIYYHSLNTPKPLSFSLLFPHRLVCYWTSAETASIPWLAPAAVVAAAVAAVVVNCQSAAVAVVIAVAVAAVVVAVTAAVLVVTSLVVAVTVTALVVVAVVVALPVALLLPADRWACTQTTRRWPSQPSNSSHSHTESGLHPPIPKPYPCPYQPNPLPEPCRSGRSQALFSLTPLSWLCRSPCIGTHT